MPLQPSAKLPLCLIISGGAIWGNLSSRWALGNVANYRRQPGARTTSGNRLPIGYCTAGPCLGALEAVLLVEEIRRRARVRFSQFSRRRVTQLAFSPFLSKQTIANWFGADVAAGEASK